MLKIILQESNIGETANTIFILSKAMSLIILFLSIQNFHNENSVPHFPAETWHESAVSKIDYRSRNDFEENIRVENGTNRSASVLMGHSAAYNYEAS